MLLNILKQINWVDIGVLLLAIRICLTAVKNGFPIELFKFIGTLAAIYLSSHYYIIVSDYIADLLSLSNKLPLEFLDFIVFVLIAIGSYVIFALLRGIFGSLLKMEAVSTLNKWGSLVLGLARASFLASLIIFSMFISSVNYFKNSVRASYCAKRLFVICPGTYTWLWNKVTSKFITFERFNDNINSVNEEFWKG
ncbi:MAG: CvpA family protein [Candidatus Omnitrophota bacterium]